MGKTGSSLGNQEKWGMRGSNLGNWGSSWGMKVNNWGRLENTWEKWGSIGEN